MNNNETILTLAEKGIRGLPLTFKAELATLRTRAVKLDESNTMEWLSDLYMFISECELKRAGTCK